MKRVKNEKDQREIVVEYYRAKWGIKDDNILKIQLSDKGEKVCVLIETSGTINESRIKSKSKKKDCLSVEETRESIEVAKWLDVRFVLTLFLRLLLKLIKWG